MGENLSLSGTYFAHGASHPSAGRLIFADRKEKAGVVALDDGATIDVVLESVSDRLGAIDRRLELSGGAVFVTGDNDLVDELAASGKGLFSRVSKLDLFHPRLAVIVGAVVALVVGIFLYGIPAAVAVAVWATPPKAVELMDASTRRTLDQLVFSQTTLPAKRREELQHDFARLTVFSQTDADLRLIFRDGGRIGANALALPGGTIVLTDQFVELVSTEQAVAVMAHEIAHVEHQHSLRQIYRALGFAAIFALVSGDLGSAAEEVLGGGGLLLAMSASRDMEFEADAEGVALLRKAGLDPIHLSTALDTLYDAVCGDVPGGREACEQSSYLSSHPGGAERREALRLLIEAR